MSASNVEVTGHQRSAAGSDGATMNARTGPLAFAALVGLMAPGAAVLAQLTPPSQPLPALLVPAANPTTLAKSRLGKALFWDEQLSSDNTMSCGSCHTPARGGGDARRIAHPSDDLVSPSADDVFASPGVIRADESLAFVRSTPFGSGVQVTDRASPTMIGAAFFNSSLFWDGRADASFEDPQTGAPLQPARSALESQAVKPILSDVEMAHADRNWEQVAAKLASAQPLALATSVPPDVALALSTSPSYAALFAAAFGDGQITAARIGLALAAYQRTLIPDQTDFDRAVAGIAPLTAAEQRGWQVFNQPNARCAACHTPPLFSNQNFHALGLRPPAEDLGRAGVTGNTADRGRFKTPTLRNAGLRTTFFHTGQVTNLPDAMRFYARAPGVVQFTENQDPLMPQINLPPADAAALVDFITGALTDPRVAAQTFPFDKPTIWQDRPADRPTLIGAATVGTGGTPRIIAVDPPMIGSTTFRLGLEARASSQAVLQLAAVGPTNNQLTSVTQSIPVTTGVDGLATVFVPLPASTTPGVPLFARFTVNDPAASGGVALTQIVRFTPFCPRAGCPSRCPGDIAGAGQVATPDGERTADDIIVYIGWFASGNLGADIARAGQAATPDAELTADDIIVFMSRFFADCL